MQPKLKPKALGMPKIMDMGSIASANLIWETPKLIGAKKTTPTAYKDAKTMVIASFLELSFIFSPVF
jgi:hypothetical protein